MIDQTEGIIFISEQREKTIIGAKTQTASVTINDNYLEGCLGCRTQIAENMSVLIIPFIGDIELITGDERKIIEENQVIFFSAVGQIDYEISNPYSNDTINFYEVLINHQVFALDESLVSVDIQKLPNQLLSISDSIKIGQYESRKEDNYYLSKVNNCVLIYIIAGAFEVKNRLLRPHDSLLLWNTQFLDFEALINDSVILIIEIPTSKPFQYIS